MSRIGPLAAVCIVIAAGCNAWATSAAEPARTVSVALMADPHFDPFRSVSKVSRLAMAPVERWAEILAESPAADDADQFRTLQAACNEGSIDASNDLMLSAFDASAQKNADGSPVFVMVAGDLLVHRFDCRYEKLLGHAALATGTKYDDAQAHPSATTAGGLMEFAAKTVDYVALELHRRFPQTAVYISLGNNDSGCGDYQFDENDRLLALTASAIGRGWVGTAAADTQKARADYSRLGSYSLPLPQAAGNGRVIVVDDLYLSARYTTCKGAAEATAGRHLLQWLDVELTAAERRGEFVWVLTHIPPGINTYSTNVSGINVCAKQSPVAFLSSTELTTVLAHHAGTVRVLIAGHTHVDESRVFGGDEMKSSSGQFVVKGLPSVSTVSNNPPAFVTASLNPASGTLVDYVLHTATGQARGLTAPSLQWRPAYSFGSTYGEPTFTPAAVADMARRFAAGAPADDRAIATYQNFFAGTGLRRLALQAVWNQYVCHMQHDDPAAFAACVCAPAVPTAK